MRVARGSLWMLVAIALVSGCVAPTLAPAASTGPCDESLWAHVYHPDRLHDPGAVHHDCRTIRGVVEAIRREADGDQHMLLREDAGEPDLTNAQNANAQHGDLVLEPLCAGAVTQADAQSACDSYHDASGASGVHVGDHVTATGTWVLDVEHGWQELHPLTTIRAS